MGSCLCRPLCRSVVSHIKIDLSVVAGSLPIIAAHSRRVRPALAAAAVAAPFSSDRRSLGRLIVEAGLAAERSGLLDRPDRLEVLAGQARDNRPRSDGS